MREGIYMNKVTPTWFGLFHRNYIENYICLVIRAYQSIPAESHISIKKEEDRRTELVEAMQEYKSEFYINYPIAYEVGEKTKRMDICCYLNGLSERYYICFECKRFKNSTITKSHFNNEYYKEGIRRFEKGQYSSNMLQAGMISFLETGSMDKLKNLMCQELPYKAADKNMEDCSLIYSFRYVYRTMHKRDKGMSNLSIYHILLDFT